MVFKLVKTVEFSGLPHAADAIQPAHLEACHAILTCSRTVGSVCAADKPLAMSSAKGGLVAVLGQIHKQASSGKPVRHRKGRLPPPEWRTSRTFSSHKCTCAGGRDMCWGQSADSCRVLRGALWWVCVLLNTNQLPRYVPQPPPPPSLAPALFSQPQFCFLLLSIALSCGLSSERKWTLQARCVGLGGRW